MAGDEAAAPDARWRSALAVVSAAEAVAVASWLVPASVHIVEWPVEGPVRLALLAPAWQLAAWLLAGLVAAAAALVWSGTSAAAGNPTGGRLQYIGHVVTPLSLLWTWSVPYLPWLPDRLPLLLVLAGPLRWAVAIVSLVAVAGRLGWRTSLPRRRSPDRRAVFAASLVLYAGLGLYAALSVGVGGDEPHYLVIAESLLRDGDLDIENNHQRRDYRAFWPGELRPDYFERGKDGALYSIHAPGLPALILPAYAAGGRLGAVLFIALMAALTALAVFELTSAVAGPIAGLVAWAACCLTVPFVPHAWLIFPEMPGALLVAWAALWVWRSADRPWPVWVWRGLALGVLPWLHTKFVVFLAVFVAALALRLRRRPAALVAFLVPVAVSGAVWLGSFFVMFGSFSPEAPYGAYSRIYVLTRNIPHGLIGILFDQKFGLLIYSPIYLTAIAGVWLAVRRRETRFLGTVLLFALAFFVGSTARLYMFWGGSSAPARFLVPVLPCLAPFVGLAVDAARGTVARAVVGLWLVISLALAAIGVMQPGRLMLFSDPHGRARILEAIQAGSPLAGVVPTFTEPTWASQVGPLAAWTAAAAVTLCTAAVLARRRRVPAGRLATLMAMIFLVLGAVVTARPPADVRAEAARRGDMEVWQRFDGNRFRTLDYENLARADADRMRALTTLEADVDLPVASEGWTAGPFSLPPGVFEARLWFPTGASRDGEVVVSTLAGTVFGRTAGPLGNPATVRFDLQVPVGRVVVRGTFSGAASGPTRVEIVPEAVVSPSDRPEFLVRTIESLPDRDGAYLVYTDGHAYPEGGVFWSRGLANTRVFVAPAMAARLVLTLSTGPMSGSVVIRVADETRTVSMVAGELKVVSFNLPAAERLVPLEVQSSVMFRPVNVDQMSTDSRGLGCQVRIHLE